MNSFKIKSYAKINLALNVTGKKSKLHNIESLVSFIDLHDLITLKESNTKKHKIDTALKMLEKAYAARSNDPYIIDSIGWAYYLVEEYEKAENFLKRAVELMPQDPIVNDHYGDILWQLDRKIQARYFWQAVLNLNETEDAMKETIKNKLIEGLKNS